MKECYAEMAQEDEVSQNGAADAARRAGLFSSPSRPDHLRSGNSSSGSCFLLVHRRVGPRHELVDLLASCMCGQPDGGIDASLSVPVFPATE